uniref:Bromodomain protein, putative n=1 Tax=Theileria annulata TaxID=5874 RepID=A0A3B0N6C3_THEAN
MPKSDSDYEPSMDKEEMNEPDTKVTTNTSFPFFSLSTLPKMNIAEQDFSYDPDEAKKTMNLRPSGPVSLFGSQAGVMNGFFSATQGSHLQTPGNFQTNKINKPAGVGKSRVCDGGSNNVSEVGSAIEDGTMEMFRYDPQSIQGSKKESLTDSKLIQPHRMLPMFPFVPSISEEGLGKDFSRGKEHGRDYTKRDLKHLKHSLSRKSSEFHETFKGVTASVEIREMCQVKIWKKMIEKNRSLFKLPDNLKPQTSEQPPQQPPKIDPAHTEQKSEPEQIDNKLESDKIDSDKKAKKSIKDMEMAWAINRFYTLSDEIVVDLDLFEEEDDLDSEMHALRRSLRKLSNLKIKVYPYQLMNYPSKISNNTNKNLFWLMDDDLSDQQDESDGLEIDEPDQLEANLEKQQDLEQEKQMEKVEESELNEMELEELKQPEQTDEKESVEKEDVIDELELELELENELDDIENELERELSKETVSVTESTEPILEKRSEVFERFGELEEFNLPKTENFNLYDYNYRWNKFRSELNHKLTLSDFLEFENHIKSFYGITSRTNDTDGQSVGKSEKKSEDEVNIGLLLKLYKVSKTNLKLLLHYKHPEISTIVNSVIYDLNSSKIVYSSVSEDVDSKDDLLLNVPYKEDHGESVNDRTTEKGDKDETVILSGKESDVRRQWRKRLQTMSKETRLALVNMGKSLKYIENAFMNIESSRAYDSMVEYCEVNTFFKNCDYVNILNHSFDSHYLSQGPHETGKDDEILNKRELIHTRVARNLVNILPLVGNKAKIHFSRFHKLDFRTSVLSSICGSKKKKEEDQKWSIKWQVYPVVKSIINMNYKDDDIVDGLQNHCSNYFVNSADLSLNDDTKIVLLEYVEQYPLLLNNIGMTSRIDTYINSTGGNGRDNGEQNNKENVLGNVVYNNEYELFGVNHQLKPNEIQSIVDNTLFKAPIFYPLNSNEGMERKKKTLFCPENTQFDREKTQPETEKIKPISNRVLNNNNDILNLGIPMYDFIMTRSSINSQSNQSNETNSGADELLYIRELDNSLLCTVGQCEPKITINSPKSKNYLEDNKLLLKAWVLKTAMINPLTDMKRLRKVARKKFYPVIPEKEITAVLKQVESTSIFSMRPQALEKMIQATIKPEVVCSLESTRSQKFRVKSRGISRLMSHEGISVVCSILQQQENHFKSSISQALEKLKSLKKTYYTRLVTLNIDQNIVTNKLQKFNIPLNQYTLYGLSQSSNDNDNLNTINSKNDGDESKETPSGISARVGYIEKILKLTSWNIANDVRMVLKGNGQFSLYGLGDPSNSGLAINLLKRQIYTNINTNMGSNIYNISIVGNNYEDLRKLSMEELSKRLLMYGVSEAVIKTLPRWDQVALVRQYRDGFGVVKNFDDSNKFRIPPSEYQSQLRQIILKQKSVLIHSHLDYTEDEYEADEKVVRIDSTDLINVNKVNDIGADSFVSVGNDSVEKVDDIEKEREELRLLKESINMKKNIDLVIDDSNLIPVLGLMWLRQSRKTPSEPFGSERAVFVYGQENIEKVLRWRKRCAEKKTHIPNETIFVSNVNNNFGKRICRNCGQSGHIASNPKCPLYSGDKLKHDPLSRQTRKEPEVDTSDDDLLTKPIAIMKDTESLFHTFNTTYDSDIEFPLEPSESKRKRSSDTFDPLHRLKYHQSSDFKTIGTSGVDIASTVNGGVNGLNNINGVDIDDHGIIGTPDIKIINKIITSIEKENRYKPFMNRISETIAPNYYKVIQKPVWLSLIKLRVKNKYYTTISSLMTDILLLEINCKLYNSEHSQNAWLRHMSQILVDDLSSRISSHIQNKQHAKLIQHIHSNHINSYRNSLNTLNGFAVNTQNTVNTEETSYNTQQTNYNTQGTDLNTQPTNYNTQQTDLNTQDMNSVSDA